MRALTCLVLLFAVVLPIPSILAAVTPEEDAAKETNNVQVGDAKSRCNNCCGGWSYGRCNRWCCSPNEAKLVDTQAGPQEPEAADQKSNQVDDAKTGCNNCCGGWSYGRCKRWCCSPNEANSVDAEVLPAEAADQQSNPQVGDEKQRGGGRGGGRYGGGRGGGHRGGGRGGGGGGGRGGGRGGGGGGGGGK